MGGCGQSVDSRGPGREEEEAVPEGAGAGRAFTPVLAQGAVQEESNVVSSSEGAWLKDDGSDSGEVPHVCLGCPWVALVAAVKL